MLVDDIYSTCVYSNCPILDEDEKTLNSWQLGMESGECTEDEVAPRLIFLHELSY